MAVDRQAKGATPFGGSGATSAPEPSVRAGRNYLLEVWVELKKTTWPTHEEAHRLTLVVLGVIIALSIYMGVLDAVLSWLVNKFSLIK